MIHFVTHFDEHYAPQGLAMLESLRQVIGDYDDTPSVLCLTDECVVRIGGKSPTTLLLTRLEGLEIEMAGYGFSLRELRQKRTWKEYVWSLEPVWCLSQIESLLLFGEGDIIVYADADQYFYADPMPGILAALEHADVALTPHNFPPGRDKSGSVGRFNFGLAAFRVCESTRNLVRGWLEKTLERCDEHSAGHQLYLDEWPELMGERFAELPRGFNVGPWQLARITPGDPPMIDDNCPVVSAHFHEFRSVAGRNPIKINGQQWNRCNYEIHPLTVQALYLPYEAALQRHI